VREPDFTECVELLREACSRPEFDAELARDLIKLVHIGIRGRWSEQVTAVGHHNVNYGVLDNGTIAALAVFYHGTTGREPHGLSYQHHGENAGRRIAQNPFPVLVQAFFAALGRPLGNERLHEMIKAAWKQVPEAFPTKR